jgi:putative ABC transport system permease protein
LLLRIESVFQDVHFGLRMLRKNPVVTGAAVLSLSLAIGACAGAFTLIDALYFRPLPVRDPSRLVLLQYLSSGQGWLMRELFDNLTQAVRNEVELFGFGLGSFQPAIFDDAKGEEERLQVQVLSGDAFRILGITPTVGRVLTVADDGHSVAMLSHSCWARRFRSDPGIVGRWFTFRGKAFQIVGVAQKGSADCCLGIGQTCSFPTPTCEDGSLSGDT